jgi:lysophospholipase L1-like esterase
MTFFLALKHRVAESWSLACVLVVNSVLIFVVVNLFCWAVIGFRNMPTAGTPASSIPFKYKTYHESLAQVYPGMSRDDINQLLTETRRIPQVYEPYVENKEPLYKSRYVNISEPGFRRSKEQGQWPPVAKEYRVFLFGGSTTFGYGVPDDQTIASFLQSILRNAGVPARCYNFGRAYYLSTQERIWFEQLAMQGFIPDLCIFIDGVNDLVRPNGMPPYSETLSKCMAEADVPLTRKVLFELPAVKIFLGALFPELSRRGSSVGPNHSPKTHERIIEEVASRYLWNKRRIESLCKDLGISVAFVWQPAPVYKYDESHSIFRGYDHDGIAPYLRHGYEFMGERGKRQNWDNNFIWLADMQEDMKRPLYVSGLHYSAEMSQAIAQRLYEAIAARGLLNPQVYTRSQTN